MYPFYYDDFGFWNSLVWLSFLVLVIIIGGVACGRRPYGGGANILFVVCACLMFIMTIVSLVIGSFLVVASTKYIDNIVNADLPTLTVPHGTRDLNKDMSDMLLGLASVCCNATIKSCFPSVDPGADFCFEDSDIFYRFRFRVRDREFCRYGYDNGHHHRYNSCDDGNVFAFLDRQRDQLRDSVLPLGIFLLVFGSILFFGSILGCAAAAYYPEKTVYRTFRVVKIPNNTGAPIMEKNDIPELNVNKPVEMA